MWATGATKMDFPPRLSKSLNGVAGHFWLPPNFVINYFSHSCKDTATSIEIQSKSV